MSEEQKQEIIQEKTEINSLYFKRRIVPNDNSCLFHSIGYCLNFDEYNKNEKYYMKLRKLVSEYLIKNEKQYTNQLIGIYIYIYIVTYIIIHI